LTNATLAILLAAGLALGGCSLRTACAAGQLCAPAPDRPMPGAGYQIYSHAHNDYEHRHPLWDALGAGFHSVEADVYYRHGELMVSHDGRHSKGTLGALYLEPLAGIVEDNRGSVFGDDAPFYLWLDLKEDSAGLRRLLRTELEALPMLTRFRDDRAGGGGEQLGAVTVVLTGEHQATEALAADPGPRPYCRDSKELRLDDPDADERWRFYSLRYGDYVGWNGHGAPDVDDLRRLACLAANAHARGRKLRLWDTPDTQIFWQVALASGIDFIGTDQLGALSTMLADRCLDDDCGAVAGPWELPAPTFG
jgi:hypothetical protein